MAEATDAVETVADPDKTVDSVAEATDVVETVAEVARTTNELKFDQEEGDPPSGVRKGRPAAMPTTVDPSPFAGHAVTTIEGEHRG